PRRRFRPGLRGPRPPRAQGHRRGTRGPRTRRRLRQNEAGPIGPPRRSLVARTARARQLVVLVTLVEPGAAPRLGAGPGRRGRTIRWTGVRRLDRDARRLCLSDRLRGPPGPVALDFPSA